jgi:FkbH-like protein
MIQIYVATSDLFYDVGGFCGPHEYNFRHHPLVVASRLMLDLDFAPIDQILKVRKTLKRDLAAAIGLHDLRIAVLGGSTTNEFVNLLELLLLYYGFRPTFYQSEYGQYYEDAVHNTQILGDFAPDIVYIHTSCLNLQNLPSLNASPPDNATYLNAELSRYREVWDSLDRSLGCQVIQNNFEMAPSALLGNMDAVAIGGRSRFLMELNVAFAIEAAGRPRLLLQDVHGISARFGLKHWFDWRRYFSYKLLLTAEANLELARSLSSMVRAVYGRTRKVLVLDLDNTLWGGVIGDDGVDKIQIGRETPVGEAYTAFQAYCLSLRNRGILLAACSKNNEDVARSGFEHPSSILKLEHFSSFKANWEPKHENITSIAAALNLSVDSLVFLDDNPAERALVAAQLPGVAVPDIGEDVTQFAACLEQGRYFEPAALSKEDLNRASLYADNSHRAALQARFPSYAEYLESLEMQAEIAAFRSVYLERIAQLINKTNQFNLTTRRYTVPEIESIAKDPGYVTLYGTLRDRFGDNGLVSVVIGRREADALHLDLWLMSCRVLKRDMEVAMLDTVAAKADKIGVRVLYGYYVPTIKNGMVADCYPKLGFASHTAPNLNNGTTVWVLDLANYKTQNVQIKIASL